jgi:hypothetical protein
MKVLLFPALISNQGIPAIKYQPFTMFGFIGSANFTTTDILISTPNQSLTIPCATACMVGSSPYQWSFFTGKHYTATTT